MFHFCLQPNPIPQALSNIEKRHYECQTKHNNFRILLLLLLPLLFPLWLQALVSHFCLAWRYFPQGAHCRADLQAAAHPTHTVCGLAEIPAYAQGARSRGAAGTTVPNEGVWWCYRKVCRKSSHLTSGTWDRRSCAGFHLWNLGCGLWRNHLYQVLNHSKEVEKFSWTEESCLSHTCFDQTES